MLTNRVYLGELHNGEFVREHAHPPLTDPVTWQLAQSPRMRSQRTARPANAARGSRALRNVPARPAVAFGRAQRTAASHLRLPARRLRRTCAHHRWGARALRRGLLLRVARRAGHSRRARGSAGGRDGSASGARRLPRRPGHPGGARLGALRGRSRDARATGTARARRHRGSARPPTGTRTRRARALGGPLAPSHGRRAAPKHRTAHRGNLHRAGRGPGRGASVGRATWR